MQRAALRMFEVEDDAAGVRVLGDTGTGERPLRAKRRVTLRGEIIDPKCFAGAMKPGDGKAHKGCAVLCLRGGIPAVFVTSGEVYLVVGADGVSLAGEGLEAVLPFVGDRVEVSGEAGAVGDLKLLYLSGGAIRRL